MSTFFLVSAIMLVSMEACNGFHAQRFVKFVPSLEQEQCLVSRKASFVSTRMDFDRGISSLKQFIFPGDSAREEQLYQSRSKLLELVDLRQSRKIRSSVEEALEQMILLKPRSNVQDGELLGTWRLIWSSQTADVNPFQKPSQVIYAMYRIWIISF
jgi:hypothetical protein